MIKRQLNGLVLALGLCVGGCAVQPDEIPTDAEDSAQTASALSPAECRAACMQTETASCGRLLWSNPTTWQQCLYDAGTSCSAQCATGGGYRPPLRKPKLMP